MSITNGLFEHPDFDNHERVLFVTDAAAGLRAIIAIHSTRLGPALGGVRRWLYPNSAHALSDALRLSKGMTLKAAVAGLDLGGGKAVILADGLPATRALWESFGDAVESLGGAYITAEDVGASQADLDIVRSRTCYAAGVSPALGGLGDPSDTTARGVVAAMHAVAARELSSSTLEGRHIVILGVGKVGQALARHLGEAGAKLTIADLNPAATQAAALRCHAVANVVGVDQAHRVPCDFFAPCALGSVLTPTVASELNCKAVIGSANNQLSDLEVADILAARQILYAPDFVVNAGGLIQVAAEHSGRDQAWIDAHVAGIGTTITAVLDRALRQNCTPEQAAEEIAQDRLASSL